MEIVNRVLDLLKERRQNILDGNINCIPLPFSRFRSELPGIEKGMYYLVSGASKAGKTQLATYLFIFNTIFYAYHHREQVHPKFFYYNLEETEIKITLRFMSYLLYTVTEGRERISPVDLRSTNENKVLPQEIIDLFETEPYKSILAFYEECMDFRPSRNPTGKKDLEVKKIHYIFAKNLKCKDYDWYL